MEEEPLGEGLDRIVIYFFKNLIVFLKINDSFKDFFTGNLSSFLELYNRREESVFYKEQFRLFLEKNKTKEIINFLKFKLANREDFIIDPYSITLFNKFNSSKETLEISDRYLHMQTSFNKSVLLRYLCEYDSEFILIDLNNNKIERLALVN